MLMSIVNYNTHILTKFLNHYIFFTIRKKIFTLMKLVIVVWKKYLNTSFLVFFFEAIYKIKPSLGFHFYILKRKNRKRIIKLKVFLMGKNTRLNKSIFWLYSSIARYKDLSLVSKILGEIYYLNFYNKSYALNYKLTHYNIILNHKLSKHFFW